MAKFAKGRVEVFCGPQSCGAPDNLLETIVNFIDEAKYSLDIAVQELESRPIAEAIIRAKARKVRIRMVVEQDYLRASKYAYPFSDTGKFEDEDNRELFAALLRASIDVRCDFNPKIFHQKFIIRDIGKNRRAVLTGSTNFTWTGVGRKYHPGGDSNEPVPSKPSYKGNLNHAVIVHDARLASEYQDEFDDIWSGTFGAKQSRDRGAPRKCSINRLNVWPIFAPDHTPELEIMKQILQAREKVDFAIFTFAQSSGIDDAFVRSANAGIKLRGVFDRSQGNQEWAATKLIANAGSHLPAEKKPEAYVIKPKSEIANQDIANVGKLHHKLMVIDDQVSIIGSFNYTNPANRLNDENILIIGDLNEESQQGRDIQREIAAYFTAEINRIIADLSEPVDAD